MFAYDYPLMGMFWTMLWWFLLIAWFVLLFKVIADIFRSPDLGGWAKALWSIFVVFLPWLGVFVYLIARGHKMTEHAIQDARNQEAAFRSYVQDTVSTGSAADEIAKLGALQAQGVLTEAEFAQQKAKLLA